MENNIEQIRSGLKEIENKLCNFIATITIEDGSNILYPLRIPYYSYKKDINDEQKKTQIKLHSQYSSWKKDFLLLTTNMPKDREKEIDDAISFLQNQINLEPDLGTKQTSEMNIIRIREHFKFLYDIIALL